MTRIRAVDIQNFRCIERCVWYPRPGINCLIGPGDSGKSTLLEAIDLCLGARRNWQFTDADFHGLNPDNAIRIAITIGELEESFKRLEGYGNLVRSFDATKNQIEDEPEKSAETVLTIVLTVGSNLEPAWTWYSERGEEGEISRVVSWSDRQRLSPTWIGAHPAGNLAWRRGSVLTRLSDEQADVSEALAKAAREARKSFGDTGVEALRNTLDIVRKTADELGVSTGTTVKAMLDAQSVTFSGGTIALHSEQGVPLAALGTGSARLLIVGLQRKAAQSSIVLIDELETGLEPHRIIRLIGSLGAKEKVAPLQVFMTTHSPAVVCELAAKQLFVVRESGEQKAHTCQPVPTVDEIQGTLRSYPEAFLARSVLVCEGASEVGFIRGIDQFRSTATIPIAALGVALVDGKGVDTMFAPARAFRALGYRTATLRDDDKQPGKGTEDGFTKGGGTLFCWRQGRRLEDEIFRSVSEPAVQQLLDYAVMLRGDDLVNDHIKTASGENLDLAACRTVIDAAARATLGQAAATKKNSWFKTVTDMEYVGREIVGPDLEKAESGFRGRVSEVFQWAADGN